MSYAQEGDVVLQGQEGDGVEGSGAGADEDGEVVVVTGSRTRRSLKDTPVATEVIGREQIEKTGSEELATLLERSAGVEVVRGVGGAGVRLQGMDPEHVLILVDGQRMEGRVGGVVDMTRFSTENIEQIEIVRGAGSVLYGADAMGGVIHIRTRSAKKPWTLKGSGRWLTQGEDVEPLGGGDVQLSASGQAGKFSGVLTGSLHRQEAFDLDPSDPATSGSAQDRFALSGRGDMDMSGDARLTLRGEYGQSDRQAVDATGVRAVFDRRNVSEYVRASAESRVPATSRLDLSLLAGYGLFKDQYVLDQRGSDALDVEEDTQEQTGELKIQADLQLGESNLLSVGVDGFAQELSSDRLGDDGDGRRLRVAFFAHNEWFVEDQLSVVPGVRLDMDSQFGTFFTPNLSTRVDLTESATLRMSAGRGYRAPTFREQLLLFENPSVGYVVAGNPDLDPETSTNTSAHVQWDAHSSVTLSAQVYANWIQDLITVVEGESEDITTTRFSYANVREAQTLGADLRADLSVWSGGDLSLGYTILQARDLTLNRALEGRPRHRGSVGLSQEFQKVGVTLHNQWTLVSSRPFYRDDDGDGEDETYRAEPYALMDMYVSKDLTPSWELFAGGQNLLNAGDPVYFPAQPRRFFIGLRMGFSGQPQTSFSQTNDIGLTQEGPLEL